MRAPWKRRAEMVLDDHSLEIMIKDMLSGIKKWEHRTLFNEVVIRLNIRNSKRVRLIVQDWLERITKQ